MYHPFEPDAVLVHFDDLDQIRVLPEALIYPSFDFVSQLRLFPRIWNLAHLIGPIGVLVEGAEAGTQDDVRVWRAVIDAYAHLSWNGFARRSTSARIGVVDRHELPSYVGVKEWNVERS